MKDNFLSCFCDKKNYDDVISQVAERHPLCTEGKMDAIELASNLVNSLIRKVAINGKEAAYDESNLIFAVKNHPKEEEVFLCYIAGN